MDDRYFYPTQGGCWAIRVKVGTEWIDLVQDSYLDDPKAPDKILAALGIALTLQHLDLYFPIREGQGRCPTLDLLELTTILDPTNPKTKKRKGEVGV